MKRSVFLGLVVVFGVAGVTDAMAQHLYFLSHEPKFGIQEILRSNLDGTESTGVVSSFDVEAATGVWGGFYFFGHLNHQ